MEANGGRVEARERSGCRHVTVYIDHNAGKAPIVRAPRLTWHHQPSQLGHDVMQVWVHAVALIIMRKWERFPESRLE